MKLFKAQSQEKERATAPMFLGTVYIQSLTKDLSQSLGASRVSFEDGARNTFHTHDGDQILVVTEGEGTIASESEELPMGAG